MKYILISFAAFGVFILAGWMLIRLIDRRHALSEGQRMVTSAIIAVSIAIVSFLGFMEVYYHADESVGGYLVSSDTVKVEEIDDAYFFDGPGDSAAVIFYQGGKVEETAYAPLMHLMAEQGTDCFLMKLPLRMAELDANAADDIIERYRDRNYEWYLMGHSLGGTAAGTYTAYHPDKVRGLILLAAYPVNDQDSSCRLLSMYGDRDGVLETEAYNRQKTCWPPDSSELVISGGNHSGMGCYGLQKGDNKATISSDEQQTQVAEAAADFIDKGIEGEK